MTKVYTGICPLQIVVEDITKISQSVLEDLDVGDIVAKLTNGDKHCYRVSYKKKGVGMCLTYADASRVETVSYDCIEGVWTYNSTDVSELGGSSGTKLYKHTLVFNEDYGGELYPATIVLITTSSTSLVGKQEYQLNDYITGWREVDNGEDSYKAHFVIKKLYDQFKWFDINDEITTLVSPSPVVSDTITEL